jgi:hypothetical protein
VENDAFALAVDKAGDVYVTGYTDSPDFPTKNAIQPKIAGVIDPSDGAYPSDCFVAELNPTGTGLVFSTYLGGSEADIGGCIAVDSSCNIYVAGYTYSIDFPTHNAIQSFLACTNLYYFNANDFVTEIASNHASVVYSTYYGGNNYDAAAGIAVDNSGNASITGGTSSTNFPTTNAISSTLAGGYDTFVLKLGPGGTNRLYSTYT